MACVITAPASNNGKTLLSLLLASWARYRLLNLQTFKVGPDYLDPQHLSAISGIPCRNLDLILCNPKWVKESFLNYGNNADLTLVEGVMGLFDGIGSSEKGSTADIAKFLHLPIVLVIDASGQAASLGALIKGFREQDPQIKLEGVVLNRVNTKRHKDLLQDVLDNIGVKMLGCLPNNIQLNLPSRHLGLVPAHEFNYQKEKIEAWSAIAEANLDLKAFKQLLKSPTTKLKPQINQNINLQSIKLKPKLLPVAIAEDEAFHFRYPEIKESLEALGMPPITWKPTKDEAIPPEAKGLIIPGGFPEEYAKQISNCKRSLQEIRKFYGRYPIYAECGGMLLLGETLSNFNGEIFPMAGLLPFNAIPGKLKVGYRSMECKNDGLITRGGKEITGHEFHYWDLNINEDNTLLSSKSRGKYNSFSSLWKVKGYKVEAINEGWGNKMFHASWIHLHWPSSKELLSAWRSAVELSSNN